MLADRSFVRIRRLFLSVLALGCLLVGAALLLGEGNLSDQSFWLVALWVSWVAGVAWILARQPFSPPALGLAAIMLAFVIIPATTATVAGRTVFAGVDYTQGSVGALEVSVLAMAASVAGLAFARLTGTTPVFPELRVRISARRAALVSLYLFLASGVVFAAYTALSGADLTKFVAILGGATYGAFTNSAVDTPSGYLSSLAGAVSGSILLAVVAGSRRGASGWLLYALALMAAFFLVAGGGRARLAATVIAAGLVWIKLRGSKRAVPARALTIVGIVLLLAVGGVVGIARGTEPAPITLQNVVQEEAGQGSDLFSPLAGLMQTVPARYPYLLGRSYLEVFYFPVPRALWPGKPVGSIIQITGTFANQGNGESFPEYGELYANFGIMGVGIGTALFAFVMERLWLNFVRCPNPSRLFVRPVLIAVMLQVFTRDYAVGQLAGFLGLVIGAMIVQRAMRSGIVDTGTAPMTGT